MFNNVKSLEFFNPKECEEQVHCIGVGAVGSAICELLVRTGLERIHIWDMDTVSEHNLANQAFRAEDCRKPKVDAMESIMLAINPEIQVVKHGRCTEEDRLSGYIFLAIDNIDIRKELCQRWSRNPNIKLIIDGRMSLIEGTIHAADWSKKEDRKRLLGSMNYTHEEAESETPVSACGMPLSIIMTPRITAAYMVANFIKFVKTKGEKYDYFVIINGYDPFVESYHN